MKEQKVCVLVGILAVSSLLLTNNMFSHKPQKMQNENITSYNEIMIHTKNLLSPAKVEVSDSIQGVAGVDEYAFKELKIVKNDKKNTKSKKKAKAYSKEELMLLAGIIQNEAGSDFCSDKHMKAVGSVILNRVKSDKFPDTIKSVIFQKGQYAINNKAFYNPSKRAIKNAKYVLEHGSILPKNCVFQAEFVQGDFIYVIFKTPISTTYICGINQ